MAKLGIRKLDPDDWQYVAYCIERLGLVELERFTMMVAHAQASCRTEVGPLSPITFVWDHLKAALNVHIEGLQEDANPK